MCQQRFNSLVIVMFFREFQVAYDNFPDYWLSQENSIIELVLDSMERWENPAPASMPKCDFFAPFSKKKTRKLIHSGPVYVLWKMVLPTNFVQILGAEIYKFLWTAEKSPNSVPVQEHLEHYWKTYFHHHFDPKSFRRWFSPRGSNPFGAFWKIQQGPSCEMHLPFCEIILILYANS